MRPLLSLQRGVLAVGLLVGSLPGSTPFAYADYQLGHGLALLDDRLTLGGYLVVDGRFLDHGPNRVLVGDLSSFVTLKLTNHWLVFAEGEVEDPVHVGHGGVGSGSDVFGLERLYAQWQQGDRFRVRVGKMLTPIGIWNPIHADPLVWTTSRPITSAQFFDTGVTGAEATMFAPFRNVDFAITAFGQLTPHLDDTNDPQESRRSIGARVDATPARGPRFGASFLRFHDHVDRRMETTFAGDAAWAMRIVEVSAEFSVNSPDSGKTTWGAYLQAVLHAGWHLHPFLRVEYADLATVRRVPVVAGVAWKPRDPIVLKLEGIVGGNDTSLGGNGVLTSFSVLF